MPNDLNRDEWNSAAVAVLIAKPYEWPEKDAKDFISCVAFDESYNEGQTPAEAIRNDSDYWD